MPVNFSTSLNGFFEADPDGAETWGALQQAQFDRLKAATAHEQWLREEHARQAMEAGKRKVAEAKKKQDDDVAWAFRRLLHMEEPPRRRGNVRSFAPPPIDRFQQRQRELRELPEEPARRPDAVQRLLAKAKRPRRRSPPRSHGGGGLSCSRRRALLPL